MSALNTFEPTNALRDALSQEEDGQIMSWLLGELNILAGRRAPGQAWPDVVSSPEAVVALDLAITLMEERFRRQGDCDHVPAALHSLAHTLEDVDRETLDSMLAASGELAAAMRAARMRAKKYGVPFIIEQGMW
jgi:hypothetical protein